MPEPALTLHRDNPLSRAALLASLGELLDLAGGELLELSVTLGGYRVSLKIEDSVRPSNTVTVETPHHDAPEQRQEPQESGLRGAVLDLLAKTPRPLKGAVIALRLGKDYQSSYFRRVMGELRRAGKVNHIEGEGYTLPPGGTNP